MTGMSRVFPVSVFAMIMAALPGNAAEIDRTGFHPNDRFFIAI